MYTKRNKFITICLLSIIFVVSTIMGSLSLVAIAQEKSPIIITFDNQKVLKDFDVGAQWDNQSWNSTETLENGYLHMKDQGEGEDGFQMQAKNFNSVVDNFDVGDYPYFKVRFKRTSIANSRIQIYIAGGSRSFILNDAKFEDQWMTILVDLSVNDSTTNSVFYYVESSGESGAVKYNKDNFTALTGDPLMFRFSPIRGTTASRTADIEYMAFFATKQEAENYNGSADLRLANAENTLKTLDMTLSYGDGKDIEKVKTSVVKKIEEVALIGSEVSNFNYTPPQIGVDGALSYDVTLISGGKSKTVTGLSVVIEAIPEDPMILRFNDQSLLTENKITSYGASFSIDDGVLRMEQIDPVLEDGFCIEFYTDKVFGDFRQQDYPYVKIKYKQMQGGGTYQTYYSLNGDKYGGCRTYLLNWETDVWLEIILDMTSYKNAVEIYNTETKQTTYQNVYNDGTWTVATSEEPFEGLSDHFRFTFGRRNNLERVSYVEYIAFFATKEQALTYEDEWENVKANAETDLSEQTFVSKFDYANTQTLAISKAKELVGAVIGNYFDITITPNSFVAPTKETDGNFTFSITVTNSSSSEFFIVEDLSMRIISQDGKSDLVTLLENVSSQEFSVGYSAYSTEQLAKTNAKLLIENSLPDGINFNEFGLFEYKESTKTEKGVVTINAVLSVDDYGETVEKTVSYTINIDVIPSEYVPILFNSLSSADVLSNAQKSFTDGRFLVNAVDPSQEDQFSLLFSNENPVRLDDYPYIKIRYKKTGHSGNGSGNSILYFYSDKNQSYSHPDVDCTFSLGGPAEMNKEMFAILDMVNGTISLYNIETNSLVSQKSFMSYAGTYTGFAVKYMFNLARWITVERSIALDYITFCSSLDGALSYNEDSIIASAKLDGTEYIVSKNQIEDINSLSVTANITAVNELGLVVGTENKGIYVNADGNIIFKIGGQSILADTVNVINGKWSNIFATIQGQTAKIYLNGELVKEGTLTNAVSSSKLFVGGFSAELNTLKGFIADVKLWTESALPTTDVEPEYAWSLKKRSQNNEYKPTVSLNPLVYYNAYGHLYHEFLGADSIVVNNDLLYDPMTVETWIKSDSVSTANATIMSNGSFKLAIKPDGNLQITTCGITLSTTNLNLYNGKWTHISVVKDYNSNKVLLYINGELFTEWNNLTITAVAGEKTKFTFGSETDKTTLFYKGSIGETRLWKTVRTATQISENYKAYYNGDTTDLIANWKFEYSSNLVYPDMVGSNGAKIYAKTWYKTNIEKYQYTIVVVPDTQDQVLVDPSISKEVANYLLENKEELNIIAVTAMGDQTQNNTELEWKWIYEAFSVLEDQILYIPIIGNHDYPSLSGRGSEIRDGELFNKYWSYEFLSKQEGFGGVFEKGRTDNYYVFFTDGTVEYIAIVTEFAPRDEVLEWANIILKKHQDKKAIILTHAGAASNGDLAGEYSDKDKGQVNTYLMSESTTCNESYDIWSKVINRNQNVVYMFSGHVGSIGMTQRENSFGDKVTFIVCDGSQVPVMPSGLGLTGFVSYNDNGESIYYQYSPTYDAYYCSDYFYGFQANIA